MLYICVTLVAGALSLARILLANPSALSTLVWAEDGLFPLCIVNHDYFRCLVDPYAGYLLFLSRTLALPVSWFPLNGWPAATNITAALAIGALTALVMWLLIKSGWSKPISLVTALIPVCIPIAGFESVNASGSAYMLLLVAASILVCFPVAKIVSPWVVSGVLVATALTIPSSLVLFLPLTMTMLTPPKDLKRFTVAAISLGSGLVAQLVIALTAADARQVAITVESLNGWVT